MTNVKKLLDTLRTRLQVKSDSDLADELRVDASVICRARADGRLGNTLIVRISERLDLTAAQIRQLGS
jgi:hypothetical protein